MARPPGRPPLYRPPFVALLGVIFLGFGSNALIQPILPILILERGGDAALVGAVVAAFAIPSVLLRPFIGRLVDEWSRRKVFLLGTGGLGLAGLLYLVPGLPAVFANRVFHGTAWAGFNTGGNSTLAELAPPSRRAEASGLYSLMPGLSHMVLPAIGILLLQQFGFAGPFGLASAFAFVGVAIIVAGPLPRQDFPRPPRREGFWSSLIEPRAILPMLIEFLWISSNALFFVFPAVFVAANDIPVAELAGYYPVVGIVLVVFRIVSGRVIDRVARGPVLLLGVVLGIVALVIATTADAVPVLTVAGAIYAIGSSFISPIATALAIERADPARRGASMATYSLGYQLGIGLGGAVWGLIIDFWGFPAPFIAGLVPLGILGVLVLASRSELGRPTTEGVHG